MMYILPSTNKAASECSTINLTEPLQQKPEHKTKHSPSALNQSRLKCPKVTTHEHYLDTRELSTILRTQLTFFQQFWHWTLVLNLWNTCSEISQKLFSQNCSTVLRRTWSLWSLHRTHFLGFCKATTLPMDTMAICVVAPPFSVWESAETTCSTAGW